MFIGFQKVCGPIPLASLLSSHNYVRPSFQDGFNCQLPWLVCTLTAMAHPKRAKTQIASTRHLGLSPILFGMNDDNGTLKGPRQKPI